ncbi:MAG TPA: hypothetical protein VFN10_13500 [Thermoanaerobaculia bacterium]|nr:hypothetical protein [Thermoanaerobaculia bacterium]
MHAADDSLDELPFDGFPVYDDFAVVLGNPSDTGHHIEFVSVRHGRLAHFPAWDHAERDLPHFTPGDVPHGTLHAPFDDRDDEWRMLLFEHGGYVYVLEAHAPNANEFPRFFRVPSVRYIQAWAALIDQHNPLSSLEDVFGEADA